MENNSFLHLMEESDFAGFILAGERRKQGGARFQESFAKFFNLINDRKLGKYKFGAAMEEAATTSDFLTLLGTVLDVQMVTQYKAIPPELLDWKQYIKTGTQGDFRPNKLVAAWGLDTPLKRVPEHGEYPEGAMQEGFTGITLSKFGKSFGLSWEAIINDRMGAFTGAAEALGRGAAKSELRFASGLYVTVAGPNPLLFGVNQPNRLDRGNVTNLFTAMPLTSDNLATAIANLRNQRDVNNEPIFFGKVHVVVAPKNEMNLKRILSPAALIVNSAGTGAGTKPVLNTSANVLNQYDIVPHTNPYLPIIDQSGNGDGTWYVFIDKDDATALQVNYLRGHENPETFMKASNQTTTSGGAVSAMEGSFEDDTIWWKVRHVFGGTTVDNRGAAAYVPV